jgi:hypothetical protein
METIFLHTNYPFLRKTIFFEIFVLKNWSNHNFWCCIWIRQLKQNLNRYSDLWERLSLCRVLQLVSISFIQCVVWPKTEFYSIECNFSTQWTEYIVGVSREWRTDGVLYALMKIVTVVHEYSVSSIATENMLSFISW